MAPRRLLVVLYGAVVGRIDQRSPTAEPEFTYDPSYVASGATPLGTRMPVADITYRGKSVRAFLEGLLPEDPETRNQWGAMLGVDPGDTVAILSRMGWDCPGAVQFCAPDSLDEMQSRNQQLEPVTETHIAERLKSLRTRDAASWTLPDEHWSLAGQQSKIALVNVPSGWYEARGAAPTTHIVKPGIGRLHHQALVEHATMRAARKIGLDVAHTDFTHFGESEPAIVVERYDRLILEDETVLRIHQEDFCSASGRLPARKYEAHGGPTLADMARIVEQNVHERSSGMAALGDFAAFNYVAGAPDGHSKNISLLLLPRETKVAPFYDLATGLPYAGNSALRELAIAVGGRRKFGQILGKHWERAASTLGIPPERYRERVRHMADTFPDAFADALVQVGTPEAGEIRARSIDPIAAHVKQLTARLDDRSESTATR
ncbi:type II toxin-antitoxin system HipA family toxin [Actinobacteria bacterium YIM 96077]|uniref:Type II toxin-antitoxin system HipA family toxin n=1 Tax=Phytoactinopolyspora halophila TaxID=1981511 RepID=A0A329QT13_9ACTN|nr:type II toxin-antitoxin system HipA family toxin [Phytoactinopolyspora halophila]AYY14960.1 type II toxin-antitoxin system HipA family toxin [Actinobacteria bacterium YIM 96077]RAW15417.1 type II toxin-antitoxin system HipA family toxin [Phytoactinopolyspora halophila]